MERPSPEHYHTFVDPHRAGSDLSDVILGGQDGLVNVLGVVLGVAAATSDVRVVIAAGMAATFAESVSMGAVAYTSKKAGQAHYESELARERRHVHLVPDLERDEIRELYRQKGFSGELLDQVVETITANRETWVGVMMAEELRLVPTAERGAIRSALVVGGAAVVGSLIPLLPFLLSPVRTAIWVALAAAAVALFGTGAYKALRTVGSWVRSGVEMAVIGLVSALVGYFVGLVFRLPGSA